MNAAKLRDFYQQSQLLLSELQALGPNVYGTQRSNAKHAQLTQLIVRIRNGTNSMQGNELQKIWEERCLKLHEDLVALTALRLQREDQSGEEFWDAVVQLQYAGAESYIERDTQINRIQAELDEQSDRYSRLLESEKIQAERHEAAAKEILELRTRVLVLQQEVQRKELESRKSQQQLQATIRERDLLKTERDKLSGEALKLTQAADRQGRVIAQIMERSELSLKERNEAVNTLKQVDEDNHMLRVNLHQHSLVIDKLINLNTEVAEVSNRNAMLREAAERLVVQLKREQMEFTTSIYMAEETPHGIAEDDCVPVSVGPGEEQLPLVHHINGHLSESNGIVIKINNGSELVEEDVEAIATDNGSENGRSWHSEEQFIHQTIDRSRTEHKLEYEDSSRKRSMYNAKNIMKGVGGKARTFLSYVAGADNANV